MMDRKSVGSTHFFLEAPVFTSTRSGLLKPSPPLSFLLLAEPGFSSTLLLLLRLLLSPRSPRSLSPLDDILDDFFLFCLESLLSFLIGRVVTPHYQTVCHLAWSYSTLLNHHQELCHNYPVHFIIQS